MLAIWERTGGACRTVGEDILTVYWDEYDRRLYPQYFGAGSEGSGIGNIPNESREENERSPLGLVGGNFNELWGRTTTSIPLLRAS